jgi:hypothetical protein
VAVTPLGDTACMTLTGASGATTAPAARWVSRPGGPHWRRMPLGALPPVCDMAREGTPSYVATASMTADDPELTGATAGSALDGVEALLDGLDAHGLGVLVEHALTRLTDEPAALVAIADDTLSRLAGDPLAGDLDEPTLAASVTRLHRLGRRVSAELHRRVAELDERDAWRVLGCRSTGDWLTAKLSMTPYEAKSVVEGARVLARLPKTAARFAAGELDVAQVQAAAKAHAELERLAELAEAADEGSGAEANTDAPGAAAGAADGPDPAGTPGPGGAASDGADGPPDPDLPSDWRPLWDFGRPANGADDAGAGGEGGTPSADEPRGCSDADGAAGADGRGRPGLGGARAELDALLAERAGGWNRAQTRARVSDWQQRLDRRYGIEREERAWRRRGGSLGVNEAEGSGWARFDLDTVGIATVKAALEPLARATSADEPRTWRQRLADALVTVCQHALDTEDLVPDSAGGRPHVLVLTTPDGLSGADDASPAHLDGLGDITPATARQLACDGTVTEIVVDARGRPLQVRETGRATTSQRHAVIARDRACIGCGAPVSRTQLHHIQHRRNHGATTVENLTLVCHGCHRRIHHHGWQVLPHEGSYRLVAPWRPEADSGIPQRSHCGRHPR